MFTIDVLGEARRPPVNTSGFRAANERFRTAFATYMRLPEIRRTCFKFETLAGHDELRDRLLALPEVGSSTDGYHGSLIQLLDFWEFLN